MSPTTVIAPRPVNRAPRRRLRRALALAGAALVALSVSACGLAGRINRPHAVAVAETNPYAWAGPITFQVQISRQLNPYSTEDAQYLAGIPKAQQIAGNQMWFGVFLWAKNQSGRPQMTNDQFAITDSAGDVYHPWPLNPQINPFAWAPQRLAADQTEPAPDTTASYGPTQGSLVLFRLSTAVYSNRPLTLDIFAPGQSKPTTITLDL
ncbi:MAG TPA: hypothetical protein VFP55_13490 [Solirubrobacteraceae bacterium]|nr:hypothetical protein [Solirubrobacteraceae bacterium]